MRSLAVAAVVLSLAGLAHGSPVTPHITALQAKTATRFSAESLGHLTHAVTLGSVHSPRTTMWDRDKTSFVTNSGSRTLEVDVGKKVFSLRDHTADGAGGTRFKRYTEKRMLGGLIRVKSTIDEQRRDTHGGSETVAVHANDKRVTIFGHEFRMGRADASLPASGPVK
jgi:hypothetical protein